MSFDLALGSYREGPFKPLMVDQFIRLLDQYFLELTALSVIIKTVNFETNKTNSFSNETCSNLCLFSLRISRMMKEREREREQVRQRYRMIVTSKETDMERKV